MKWVIVFGTLLAVSYAAESSEFECSNQVLKACNPSSGLKDDLKSCNALYSGFVNTDVMGVLQAYANYLITNSYDYLLLSTYYGNYVKNRPGFEKLYKSLSDSTWEDGIDVMKHITTRGGDMDFNKVFNATTVSKQRRNFEVNELESLSLALDMEKKSTLRAHHIHQHVSHGKEKYDPEIAHYMEEKFIEEQAKKIRTLSGYTNDLKRLLSQTTDITLGVFLFDEYLQKQ